MTAAPRHDVALVIADLGPGGAQRVLTLLANAWDTRGIAVCVVTLAAADTDFYRLNRSITRISIGGISRSPGPVGALLANAVRIWRLRQALKRSGAPVVVSFVAAMNVLTVLAGIAAPWRTVISERNDPARQEIGRPWEVLRRSIYRFADVVTANSAAALDTLGQYVPVRKLHLVRNPIDLATFAAPSCPRKEARTILTIGRLTEQKAHDIVLRAFAQLQGIHGSWRLVIVGEGPLERDLHEMAQQLGVDARVEWRSRVADVASLYRACDMFVLASRYEGLPNVVLEAMAAGRAVIVSDATAGALEYVADGQSGLIVPVDDVDALADAFVRLANDRSLCERLGAAAQRRIASDDLPLVVDQWSALLNLSPAS